MSSLRHTEENLNSIIKNVKSIGPRNAALLARRTGIPPTTVRYSLKNLLKERGIRFTIDPNYAFLGMKRFLVLLDLAPSASGNSEETVQRVAEHTFVDWYGKSIPSGRYYTLASVPSQFRPQFRELLDQLKGTDVLSDYELYELEWSRLRSIDREDYDFTDERWSVDWNSLDNKKTDIERPSTEEKPGFRPDEVDFAILRELQLDATVRLSQIARKLDRKYKVIYYHFNKHVVDVGLIRQYVAFPEVTSGRDGVTVLHLLRGLTEQELMVAEDLFHRTPFTWMDSYSVDEGVYAAFTALPGLELNRMLEYISERSGEISDRHEIQVLSPAQIRSYALPVQMMTEEGNWEFEPTQVLNRLLA